MTPDVVVKREDPSLFVSLQMHFRSRRFAKVLALIDEVIAEKGHCSILDAGGRAGYWDLLPDRLRDKVTFTLLNTRAELDAYDRDSSGMNIRAVAGDACDMPQYRDGQFDIAHSNSVIEHVGSYKNMVRFAAEIMRVGRMVYVQTPNYWFPIDPHYAFPFIHWLPDTLKIWVLSRFKVGVGVRANFHEALDQVDNCRMISGLIFRRLFDQVEYHRERFLIVFTKSHIAIRR